MTWPWCRAQVFGPILESSVKRCARLFVPTTLHVIACSPAPSLHGLPRFWRQEIRLHLSGTHGTPAECCSLLANDMFNPFNSVCALRLCSYSHRSQALLSILPRWWRDLRGKRMWLRGRRLVSTMGFFPWWDVKNFRQVSWITVTQFITKGRCF